MAISMSRSFIEMLNLRCKAINSCAAVGLDPDIRLIPQEVWRYVGNSDDVGKVIEYFCQEIIKSTVPYVCAYKIQPAFFNVLGEVGERCLKNVIDFLKNNFPDVPVIMDGKVSDISNTVAQYVQKIYDVLQADAILVNPLMGSDTVLPFVERTDKGVFILCKTSNPSSSELMDIPLLSGEPLWQYLIRLSMQKWNGNRNIGLVLSANAPSDLLDIRDVIQDVPILLAGVGAQGGNLESSIPHVIDKHGYGFFVPSSRGIIFSPAEENESFSTAAGRAARQLRDKINFLRSKEI